jgi:hypothetical protein
VGTVVGGAAVVGAAVTGVVVGARVVPVTAGREVVGATADDGVDGVLGAPPVVLEAGGEVGTAVVSLAP